ncbi:MAG: nuclear transport factor 2 family protein [Gammaproteobacteria bacterium]|nr:nuclear transport factor 2 family protein [Gammaproteobacteria bacterium]
MNDDARIAALEQQVAALTRQVGLLEDTFAVRHLQFKYGYYMDKCLYDPIIDLMADDCEIHFLGGVFRGKEGAGRLYCGRLRNRFAGGTDGPKPGLLMDHPQLQDIVDVAPDGLTARGRFRYLMQAGTHYTTGTAHQWWEGGLYENTYVKRDGAWQIQIIVPKMCYVGYYEHGWAYTKPDAINNLSKTFPEDPYGPDELADAPLVLWPQTDILPFHYPHPVTGEPVEMEK